MFALMAFTPQMRDPAIREDILEAMRRSGYSHKAAAVEAGLSPAHWSEQLATGSLALWRLELLSDAFMGAFLALRAARRGKVLMDAPDAQLVAAVGHLRAVLGATSASSAASPSESRHA